MVPSTDASTGPNLEQPAGDGNSGMDNNVVAPADNVFITGYNKYL